VPCGARVFVRQLVVAKADYDALVYRMHFDEDPVMQRERIIALRELHCYATREEDVAAARAELERLAKLREEREARNGV
jgi:hypothetical protein